MVAVLSQIGTCGSSDGDITFHVMNLHVYTIQETDRIQRGGNVNSLINNTDVIGAQYICSVGNVTA